VRLRKVHERKFFLNERNAVDVDTIYHAVVVLSQYVSQSCSSPKV